MSTLLPSAAEIDVSGYDLAETMAKERRRRAEAAEADGLDELAAVLLPLSLAVARFAARSAVEQAKRQ